MPPHTEIVELAPLIRRVVAARVRDPELVDDLTQETLARVMHARERLQDEALGPYAIVTARNLVASHARGEDRRRRHAHRLLEPSEHAGPEEQAVLHEEREAVRAALTTLSAAERETILAHEVTGVDTATLAGAYGTSSGGIAARMSRARAKLRVEYLLALHRIELPTVRCRPVLLALSSADRRRQRALNVGAHLLNCSTCSQLSQPLLRRRLPAGALLPPAVVAGWQRLRARLRDHPVQSTAAVGTVVAAAAVVGLWAAPPPEDADGSAGAPPCASSSSDVVRLDDATFDRWADPAELSRFAGCAVAAQAVLVTSVDANEGFWVAAEAGDRGMWVQIVSQGESSPRVRAGQRVSFRGALRPHGPRFPDRVGVGADEGASTLRRLGHHIAVPVDELQPP